MRTWTHIILDAINSLLGSFSKGADKNAPAIKNLKETAAKAGINIPDDLIAPPADYSTQPLKPPPDKTNNPSVPNSSYSQQPENINIEGVKGQNLERLKNPQVYKAMTNSVADMKFAQYENMGLLDLCIKQREERLNQK